MSADGGAPNYYLFILTPYPFYMLLAGWLPQDLN